jgi:CRP-like cAMP-binding protein
MMDLSGINDENLYKLIKLEAYNGYSWFTEISIYSPGLSFGELALHNDNPRAATIKTQNYCVLAMLHKDDYNRIIR